jgi:hypothetical protein
VELKNPEDAESEGFNDLVRSFYDKLSNVAESMIATRRLTRYFSEAPNSDHLHIIVEFPVGE